MNKIATTLLVSSLALGGFAVAHADYDDHEKYEKHERYSEHEKHDEYEKHGKYCNKYAKRSGSRIEYMIEHLNLSDVQAKQVRSIRDNYRPKLAAFHDKMKDNRKQLREAMKEDTINLDQVKEIAQKTGSLKTDKIILRAEMRTEIRKVLTKEQREKMKNLKRRHGYGHGYKRHG